MGFSVNTISAANQACLKPWSATRHVRSIAIWLILGEMALKQLGGPLQHAAGGGASAFQPLQCGPVALAVPVKKENRMLNRQTKLTMCCGEPGIPFRWSCLEL